MCDVRAARARCIIVGWGGVVLLAAAAREHAAGGGSSHLLAELPVLAVLQDLLQEGGLHRRAVRDGHVLHAVLARGGPQHLGRQVGVPGGRPGARRRHRRQPGSRPMQGHAGSAERRPTPLRATGARGSVQCLRGLVAQGAGQASQTTEAIFAWPPPARRQAARLWRHSHRGKLWLRRGRGFTSRVTWPRG